MAEEKPKREGKPEEAKPKAAGGGMLGKTPVLIGIVMVIEAVVLFAGFKFLGSSPAPVNAGVTVDGGDHGAPAGDGHGDPHGGGGGGGHVEGLVEVPVVDFKPPNRKSGRLYLYTVQIVAQVKPDKQERLTQLIKQHESHIKDRVRTIVAQSDPDKLGGGSEPGLETFRRQIKYQLDEIVGEGIIEKVLVPQCTPIRVD